MIQKYSLARIVRRKASAARVGNSSGSEGELSLKQVPLRTSPNQDANQEAARRCASESQARASALMIEENESPCAHLSLSGAHGS